MALKNHKAEREQADVSRETGTLEDMIALLDDQELLTLRSIIDARLEIGHIGSVDLGSEIMVQLRTLKQLQHDALRDEEAPHNQKAQAASTVSRLLADLVKSRNKLFSAERSKAVENMVIEAMKDAPQEAKEMFFERLERMMATLPTLASLMEEAE